MNTLFGTSGISINPWIIAVILVWTLPWKGVALWKSARLSHTKWFIALLIVNTFGILEIIYIYFVANKYNVETTEEKVETSKSEVPEVKS